MSNLHLLAQIFVGILAYACCQQFAPHNNQIPPRFLIPESIPVAQQFQPQSRFLPLGEQSNVPPAEKIKRPANRARVAPSLPVSLVPLEPESFATVTTGRPFSLPENSDSLPPRPVVETEDEGEAAAISTIQQPTITPTVTKTFKPSTFSFRPSKPQSPTFVTTNNIEYEETTPSARPILQTSTPSDESRQFQRKQHTPRIQVFRPNPPQQELFDKPKQQFEKPIRPKFEKPEIPEKRVKKPVAQVLRRYREDNADGSITWGFENDDGSYKEETIGNDCVTRGKYGYIDPDGVKREYTYTSGLPCDKNKLEQTEEANSPAGYVDYSGNRVILPNGDSVDLNHMVKNRARKPVSKYRN